MDILRYIPGTEGYRAAEAAKAEQKASRERIVVTPGDLEERYPEGVLWQIERIPQEERTMLDQILQIDGRSLQDVYYLMDKWRRSGLNQQELDNLTERVDFINGLIERRMREGIESYYNTPDFERNRRIKEILTQGQEQSPDKPEKPQIDWYSGEPIVFTAKDFKDGKKPWPKTYDERWSEALRILGEQRFLDTIIGELNNLVDGGFSQFQKLHGKIEVKGVTQKELDELLHLWDIVNDLIVNQLKDPEKKSPRELRHDEIRERMKGK